MTANNHQTLDTTEAQNNN